MEAFSLSLPQGDAAVPLLYDSPHSGRFYPEDFATRASLIELRRAEDAYVDELIADAVGRGVTLLAATYPRCYIDANREEDDIDPELLADPWHAPLRPSEKSRMGLGLIRRYVVPGVEIQAGKLSAAEAAGRIERVWRPYHAALAAELGRLRARFGFVWHVDWHSMKAVGNSMTPDGAGARRADFAVGDRDGSSAEPAFVELAVETLRGLGYAVSVNAPYKGASIVRRYGVPSECCHSIQIEINRGLYLDEAAVEKTAGFEKLRADLEVLTRRLAGEARSRTSR